MSEKGSLYIVSTPIGNLEDITLRALRILKEADIVAAEDTRRSKILLNHYQIDTPLISYHTFNEHRKTSELLDKVLAGQKVALVSDAGTPCIADPGFLLVREALKQGIVPVVIPGVSSLTFSIVCTGFPVERFAFYGFAPVKSGRRKDFFEKIAHEDKSVFMFESPYRMSKALDDIVQYIGPDTPTAIIREATKIHEETLRGTALELKNSCSSKNWKGEVVIAVSKHQQASVDSSENE